MYTENQSSKTVGTPHSSRAAPIVENMTTKELPRPLVHGKMYAANCSMHEPGIPDTFDNTKVPVHPWHTQALLAGPKYP